MKYKEICMQFASFMALVTSCSCAIAQDTSIGTNPDGSLEVFAGYSGWAYANEITSATSSTGWQFLTGYVGDRWTGPSVGQNMDGRLQIFDAAGAVYSATQISPGAQAWSGWSELPGIQVNRPPAVGLNVDGRLVIFALTAAVDNSSAQSGSACVDTQASPGGSWIGWSCWSGFTASSVPAVARNSDGRLEAFALGQDNYVYTVQQTTVGGAWTGWSALPGGPIVYGNEASPPAVIKNSEGLLEVYVVSNGQIEFETQLSATAGWTGWTVIAAPVAVSTPHTARDSSGNTVIYTTGNLNSLHATVMRYSGAQWTNLSSPYFFADGVNVSWTADGGGSDSPCTVQGFSTSASTTSNGTVWCYLNGQWGHFGQPN